MKSNTSQIHSAPLNAPQRRDHSRWPLVQDILARLQFIIFVVSALILGRYILTNQGFEVATASVVIKTLFLYAITYTGTFWEYEIYGQFILAPSFYWEDMLSMLVIGLHSLCLVLYLIDFGNTTLLIYIAVAAYATYDTNVAQFLMQLWHPQSTDTKNLRRFTKMSTALDEIAITANVETTFTENEDACLEALTKAAPDTDHTNYK